MTTLPPPARPRIKTLLIQFGYVEGQRTAYLAVARRGRKGFRTAVGAIGRFLQDAKEVWHEENPAPTPKACCKASTTQCCPKCGKNRTFFEKVNPTGSEFAEFLQELDGTNDSIGGDVMEQFLLRGWELGSVTTGDALEILGLDQWLQGRPSGMQYARGFIGPFTSQKEYEPTPEDVLDAANVPATVTEE